MSATAEKLLWTVERYHRALAASVLTPDDNVELINGELVPVTPSNPPHAYTITVLQNWLHAAVRPGEFSIRTQQPITLPPNSEPEPDLVLAKGPDARYRNRHPEAADVLLLIEVTDTTLARDRQRKLPQYAEQAISEVWVVDLNAKAVIVHREPSGATYRDIRTEAKDNITPACCPDITLDVTRLFA